MPRLRAKEGFTRDAAGVLTCRCGLSHAAPASLVGGGAPQPVRRTASGGRVPVRRTASGGSGGRGGGGKKKPSRVQEWLAEVAKRLSGVPRFVLTDAHAAYARTLKDTSRRGCTDLGLALASLEFALQKSRLERPRAELCAAASERVSMPQLTACAKVVRRQNAEPLPDGTPTVAHFVARLCDELKQRGQYAKAAAAVAARTVELGAGRGVQPLVVAAAVCLLVFERHTSKALEGRQTDADIAAAASVAHADLMSCYTLELLPHVHELLDASVEAILPKPASAGDLTALLAAPAPPTPPQKQKAPSARRRSKPPPTGRTPPTVAGGGAATPGAAAAAAGPPAAATAADGAAASDAAATAAAAPAAPAVERASSAEAEADQSLRCLHCNEKHGGPPGTELCEGCREDQCGLCGRVDPIATDADGRCFGCMREAVLRARAAMGALRGCTARRRWRPWCRWRRRR